MNETCQSGKHRWIDADSRSKCCNSAWVRILLVGQTEIDDALARGLAVNIIPDSSVVLGRAWRAAGDPPPQPPEV